jgi:hypothetical protein
MTREILFSFALLCLATQYVSAQVESSITLQCPDLLWYTWDVGCKVSLEKSVQLRDNMFSERYCLGRTVKYSRKSAK